jgi:hypothetical protein
MSAHATSRQPGSAAALTTQPAAGGWRPDPQAKPIEPRPMWELAECTCPDFCERDHEQD